MLQKSNRSRWIRAAAIAVACVPFFSLFGFTSVCGEIADRVVRLHVLAASDSAEDQALKQAVRDAVLQAADGLLDEAVDADSAQQILSRRLPAIRDAAQACVYAHGHTDPVTVSLCRDYFTTREYDTVTLPAGTYRTLRVTIGEGAGHNWWCVVFPPMCLSGACEQEALGDVLSDAEQDVVSHPDKYRIGFKFVEWWQTLCRNFS